jgi:sugar phosphate isomerase/epimerase
MLAAASPFLTGINPYGLTYHLGLQGAGTPRANPIPLGLRGFLDIAAELHARVVEIHAPWLYALQPPDLEDLRRHLQSLRFIPVISLGPPLHGVEDALRCASALGASTLRLGLTPVLAGDRAAHAPFWLEMIEHVRATLRRCAPIAAARGISLAIENHQDFTSQELLDFAAEAGSAVGICLDTGNPLAVAEEPLAFARRVAPLVRHVHLKDYSPQPTPEGYRLIRCAIGDGCVPFREITATLAPHHSRLTASLEPGALESRHIRLLTREWWHLYPPGLALDTEPCLAASRRAALPAGADFRTPWECEDSPAAIVDYELNMIRRSAANMRSLGLMQ